MGHMIEEVCEVIFELLVSGSEIKVNFLKVYESLKFVIEKDVRKHLHAFKVLYSSFYLYLHDFSVSFSLRNFCCHVQSHHKLKPAQNCDF